MDKLCTHQNVNWEFHDVESHSTDRITIPGICTDCNSSVVGTAEITSVSIVED